MSHSLNLTLNSRNSIQWSNNTCQVTFSGPHKFEPQYGFQNHIETFQTTLIQWWQIPAFSISAIAKMITVLQNTAGYNNASPTCIKHVDFLANKLVVCTAESATIMSRTTIWQYEGGTSRAASKASWLVCDWWTHSDPTTWNRPKLIYPIGLKSIMGVGERNYLVKAWRTSLNAVELC